MKVAFLHKICCCTCHCRYFIKNGWQCEHCNLNCETCYGPSRDHCKSCHSGWYLHASQCVTLCPEGFYNSDQLRSCQPCPGECWTCDSEISCTSCIVPFVLYERRCTQCCSDELHGIVDCCICDPITGKHSSLTSHGLSNFTLVGLLRQAPYLDCAICPIYLAVNLFLVNVRSILT